LEALSIAQHKTRTGALGAGIALTKEVFHLSARRPAEILLWAIRAPLSWALLRHWPQGALVTILIPCWLAGECWTITPGEWLPIWAGLNVTDLTARRSSSDSALRKALDWTGCIALLPSVCAVVLYARSTYNRTESWMAWSIVILAPLAVSGLLRGRQSV
jgi:hypothetical protein